MIPTTDRRENQPSWNTPQSVGKGCWPIEEKSNCKRRTRSGELPKRLRQHYKVPALRHLYQRAWQEPILLPIVPKPKEIQGMDDMTTRKHAQTVTNSSSQPAYQIKEAIHWRRPLTDLLLSTLRPKTTRSLKCITTLIGLHFTARTAILLKLDKYSRLKSLLKLQHN